MNDASWPSAAHREINHDFGDLSALLVIPDESMPTNHAAGGALLGPASTQHVKACQPFVALVRQWRLDRLTANDTRALVPMPACKFQVRHQDHIA
jgi:hypothetical protein